jgi:16S rRNA U516 pseudouridylate synthase RsuA-like enzyme
MTLSTVTQIAAILLVIIQVLPTNSFTSSRLSTFTQHHDSTYAYVHLLHTKNNNNKSNLIQLHSSASGDESKSNKEGISIGIRLNKVFKATHSRRAADDIIASGRVSINGEPVLEKGGCKVIPFQDIVSLDGKVIKGWEQMNAIDRNTYNNDNQNTRARDGGDLKTSSFEYVKYFKPLGVTCTTDLSIEGNIIDTIQRDGYRPRHRVYPVGRLDKDTSGLIILTSDGRMVNAVLRGEKKQPKIYKVMVDWELEDHHLQQLRVSSFGFFYLDWLVHSYKQKYSMTRVHFVYILVAYSIQYAMLSLVLFIRAMLSPLALFIHIRMVSPFGLLHKTKEELNRKIH